MIKSRATQKALYNWWSGGVSAINTITIYNPDHRWRRNQTDTILIIPPTGFNTVTWSILDKDQVEVDSGSGRVINTSFTLLGDYDIEITASDGVSTFNRYFIDEIEVLPELFTEAEADEVWDLSDPAFDWSRDFLGADNTGLKIFIKGDNTGSYALSLNLDRLRSNDDQDPVHLLFDPNNLVTITKNGECIKIGREFKNVLIDGCGSRTRQYGVKLVALSARSQMIYLAPVGTSPTFTTDASLGGQGITIGGIDCDGGGFAASGITIQTNNSATVNYDTYICQYIKLFDFKCRNTQDEPIYFFRFTDALSPTLAYSPGQYIKIFRYDVDECGADGFQIGLCFDIEVHSGYVGPNVATRDEDDHENGVQINPGCRNLAFFGNRIYGGKKSMALFTGRGGNGFEVFANKFYNPTTTPKINIFFRLDQNDYETELQAAFIDNTFYFAEDEPFQLWNATGAVTDIMNPLVIANNLIVSLASSPLYTLFNSFNTTNLVNNNKQIAISDVNTIGFVDLENQDFRIASQASAALGTPTAYTPVHYMVGRDFDGVEYVTNGSGQRMFGAMSGYELFNNIIVKNIVSAPDATPVTADYGTAFGSLTLPTKSPVLLSNGKTGSVDVTWSSVGYNPNTSGTYSLSGTLSNLPDDVANPLAVTASIDVTVSPLSLKLNFNGGSVTGWINSGSLSNLNSVPGAGAFKDYGVVGVNGIELKADNVGASFEWTGVGNGGGVGSNAKFPANTILTYWFTSNTDIGRVYLVGVPAAGGPYTFEFMCSRAIVGTVTRTSQMSVMGGTPQTVNADDNISTILTFTGITPQNGVLVNGVSTDNVIWFDLQGVAPFDSRFGYLNALIVTGS